MAEQRELTGKITKEELKDLSRWARVAFAVRCAWRAMPVLGRQENFRGAFSEREFGAIDCAVLAAFEAATTGGLTDLDAFSVRAGAAADAAKAVRSATDTGGDAAFRAAALAAFSAARAATADDARAAERPAMEAYFTARSAAPGADAVARGDLAWLRSKPLPASAPVSLEFFSRPLWDHPPDNWGRVCDAFKIALADIGRTDVWTRYEGILSGLRLPTPIEIDRALSSWNIDFDRALTRTPHNLPETRDQKEEPAHASQRSADLWSVS